MIAGEMPAATVVEVSADQSSDTSQSSTIETVTQQPASEIVIIDSAVSDVQQLLDDLAVSGRQADVFVLDADRDGIDQISEILDARTGVDSVHIVSHAEDGAVKLGNTWLGESNLAGYSGQIASWQTALTTDADILLYGCDLASNDSGQTLIESISVLTGADVAASTDDTGHADYAADWDLEYSTGEIETKVAFSDTLQQNWEGKLANITVTTFDDIIDNGDGLLSLREAILQVNAGSGGDTIVLGAGTYTLTITGASENAATSGDLDLLQDVTITGDGAASTIIDATGLGESVFHVIGAVVDIDNLTITGGSDNQGGGMKVAGTADVTLTNVNVTLNNAGDGGGIHNAGTVTLVDSTISDNTSTNQGGGLFNDATAVATGSTFSGNNAIDGAGIYNSNFGSVQTLTLTNVTLSGNTASGDGGGLANTELADLVNVTITNNSAADGGGIFRGTGTVTTNITNSIIASNTAATGPDVSGNVNSNGFNIVGNDSGSGGFIGSDLLNTDPLLDPTLKNNGGPTQTHAITASSPAYNAGTTIGVPNTDQRGETRDASPDIGAYEFPLATILDQFNTVAFNGNDGTQNWTGNWVELDESDGPTLGKVRVDNNALHIYGNGSNFFEGAHRIADLSGATTATLSFDYNLIKGSSSRFRVQVSTDGVIWSDPTLIYDSSFAGSESGSVTDHDISAYISSTTHVRFWQDEWGDSTDHIYFDNVRIEHEGAQNNAPTLTLLTSPVDGTTEDTEVEVSFTDLTTAGDENDVDGTVDAFVVKSISSGTLKIGATAGSATAWAAGTNDTIDGSNNAYWTPDLDANGTQNAFEVVAKDDGGLESATNVTAQIDVTAQNDPPVASNDGYLTNQDTTLTVGAGTGLLANDSDPDLDPLLVYVTEGPTNGVLGIAPTGLTGETNLTSDPGSDDDPAWSPDGSQVAFSSNRTGASEIYTMDADGSNVTRLTFDGASAAQPSWSPDGTQLVFQTTRDGNEEIYKINSDGTGLTRLTNDLAIDMQAEWSPDGTKIVFRAERDGDREIFVMDADGTNQTQLTYNTSKDNSPSWSPDGSQLVFTTNRDGNTEVYVMNADGSDQTRLTVEASGDREPTFSPDGMRIAFQSDRDGDKEIFVMNADGTNVIQLTDNLVNDSSPSWSPDGTQLLFQTSRDGNAEIYAVDLQFDGSFDYVPNAGYSGTDTFYYVANDGAFDSDVATVAITVDAANTAPTLTTLTGPVAATNEDSEVEVSFADLTAAGDENDVDGTVDA
ncbi:MAG: DUF4347 domain-containing protein, partial [Pirellulaceae bacterium]|nr:DUF4347 domain-containing protein [Pirellulaceae bacterium]